MTNENIHNICFKLKCYTQQYDDISNNDIDELCKLAIISCSVLESKHLFIDAADEIVSVYECETELSYLLRCAYNEIIL